jgi:hypothetical protein
LFYTLLLGVSSLNKCGVFDSAFAVLQKSNRIEESSSTMTVLEKLPPYFQARENHLRAMARLNNHQQKLFSLFGVNNAAELEEAMLHQRHLYAEERLEYDTLGRRADRAADIFDLATIEQRRKIAAQQKQFNAIIANLDE